jgi:2,3-bisphosphoglycerate-independent phosphoglycerate mutase
MKRPFLILIVLDGFGCRRDRDWNAIAEARKPTFDRLFRDSSWTTLDASGLAVGLPPGQMGNSEVGHLNIGAGRIVDQDIVRISKAAGNGALAANPLIADTVSDLGRRGAALHLAGLLSDGGVHSLDEHLHGLIDAAIANGMALRSGAPSIFVHAILDGRDVPPVSAKKYVAELLEFIAGKPQVRLASMIGRYFAMDRDHRWERVQRAYELMTLGVGVESSDPLATLDRFYDAGITDEFMEPISIVADRSAGLVGKGRVSDGDALLFFNFRADRMREIVSAFRDEDFHGFARAVHPRASLLSLVRYHEEFDLPVVFPPVTVSNHLGEVFARAGLRQLRIAETEKFAHVTFFFNGGSDRISPGEERILIPSPKVATYDRKPEMSLVELAARVVREIEGGGYDVVILNIANPDMVGHTGVMKAAVEAVEATDAAVASILAATERRGGIALITADHGNCELMFDEVTQQPHTAHTTNPVPFILVDPQHRLTLSSEKGALDNVAPTLLDILDIPKPSEMTARSLLVRAGGAA